MSPPEVQARRFAALSAFVPFEGHVIAQLGCDRAQLLDWLVAAGRSCVAYIGVEPDAERYASCSARPPEAVIDAEYRNLEFMADDELFEDLVDEGVEIMVFIDALGELEPAAELEVLGRAWRALSCAPGAVLAFNVSPRGVSGARHEPGELLAWAYERTLLVGYTQYHLGGEDGIVAMIVPPREPVE